MKKSLRIILPTAFALLPAIAGSAFGCTIAVVSGKATPDGRPLLWKNRDSGYEANRMMFFRGEKYVFIGIVNSEDKEGKEVWAGVNSAGFCIMNSASYNVNAAAKERDGDKRRMDEEGLFMKRALGACATVEEFEKLLRDTAGDRGIEANFGVIDAQGGASLFETDNDTYARFDAMDQRVAPEGYIVRTNYSFSGAPNDGAGYIRFDRAGKLFHEAVAGGGIDRDWILLTASRDMVNGLTGIDPLAGELPAHSGDRRFFYMSDSIARNSACSTALFQGVGPGDDPAATVMWVRLGHPLCSVALPQWVAAAESATLTTGEDDAPIDRFALHWLNIIFPLHGGSRDRYLDLAPVLNRQGDGLLTRLMAIERRIIGAADQMIADSAGAAQNYVDMQREVENLARELLRAEFPAACELVGL